MTEKVEIYTDGACSGNPGPCGIGIVMKYGRKVKEYSQCLGHGTNNIAELTAVLKALKMVKKPELPVVIYTDSQYALGVLTMGWKARENKGLILQVLEEMRRFSDLRIVKVEGHADVPLNERADELARGSIESIK
jgi:ribonuclease HI